MIEYFLRRVLIQIPHVTVGWCQHREKARLPVGLLRWQTFQPTEVGFEWEAHRSLTWTFTDILEDKVCVKCGKTANSVSRFLSENVVFILSSDTIQYNALWHLSTKFKFIFIITVWCIYFCTITTCTVNGLILILILKLGYYSHKYLYGVCITICHSSHSCSNKISGTLLHFN